MRVGIVLYDHKAVKQNETLYCSQLSFVILFLITNRKPSANEEIKYASRLCIAGSVFSLWQTFIVVR